MVEEDPVNQESVEESNRQVLARLDSQRPTILYADDNADLRTYVRQLLADRYNVLLAVDGRDGLEKAQLYRPDLIVRLTGVSVTGLMAERAEQRTLFPDRSAERRRKLEKTLLDVRARYGDESVQQAGIGGALPGRRIPS